MGEPGTSSGESGSSAASSSAASSSSSSSGSHGCCSTSDLDPAILATMTADELKKFIETGRTGRRNALPDVTEAGVITTTTSGVAEAMQSLSVSETSEDKGPEGAAGGS